MCMLTLTFRNYSVNIYRYPHDAEESGTAVTAILKSPVPTKCAFYEPQSALAALRWNALVFKSLG